ncbi:MAG: G5 domain-containing protein [Clostridia bacterium]
MLKVNDDEKASISLKRILGICLIFLFISGICVFAANKQVKNVKITLSNGCEMNVVTSKTKVADILDEKHIILLPEEKVTPDENTTIGANGEIVITEKTIVEVQAIPFETVTKNVANGASETKDQVLQEGREGKKEVTYRVKYQNDVEIERTEVSSVVLEEPVNKIVQVRAKQTTSRSSSGRTYISGSVAEYQAYARARCSAYGWSTADFNCLVALWNKESKWNPNAYNSGSGAYGIPQALPASKMATAGTDYRTNYKTQINWGLSYISSSYGSPSAAWSHSKSKGWY